MTVLLTGGAGYIGSHTAVELLNAGHDVVIADNYANSNPIVARRITQITGKPVKCYEADVADPTALERLFQENAIDSVIHSPDSRPWASRYACLWTTTATIWTVRWPCWRPWRPTASGS